VSCDTLYVPLVGVSVLSIKIHYTWGAFGVLFATIVALQYAEDYSFFSRILFGVVVALIFFAIIFLRELLLAKVIFRRELQLKKITLFFFGGVYKESADKYYSIHPPLLYLSKFLFNFLLAALFYGLYATFVDIDLLVLARASQAFTYMFFLFFIAHFIPIYPLDGGEIVRLLLWKKTRNYYRATRIVSVIGWAFGLILIFAGVMLLIITGQWAIDLLIVLFGFTVYIAAGFTRKQMRIHDVLKPIEAEDVMTREFAIIPAQYTIRRLIREVVLIKSLHYVLIVENDRLQGILTLKQIKKALRKGKADALVIDFMTPYSQMRTAFRQQAANELYDDMYQQNIEYVPIVEGEKVVGVVKMRALMNAYKIRSGFGL